MTMTDPGVELALRAQPVLPMRPDEARQVMAAYQEMTAAIIGPEDRQRVDDKEFVKRSGFQKLAAAYGVSTEIVSQTYETVRREDDTVLVARVVARAIHPSGRHADGDGACASNEKRFRKGDQRMEHNLASTASTRAVNRAISNLIAFGSVSAEEVQEGQTGPSGPLQRPDWALPMNDIAGVAQNLTHVLQAMGVDEPAAKASEIGNTVFKQCGGEFPFIAARVAGLLAQAVETVQGEVVGPHPAEEPPITEADAEDLRNAETTTSNEETE
jgi:hypothetical protein